jgi:hypothetical protein
LPASNKLVYTQGMTTLNIPSQSQITRAIETWLREAGWSEARLGLIAAANARAVPSIRGGTAQLRTLLDVANYINANPAKTVKRS